jgi:hypothetical protein
VPSELQRVAEALVTALDEMPRVVEYLLHTAQKYRKNAVYVGHMSNNPAAQVAAMQLDDAARRCEEAAHHLAQVPPKARGWAEEMVSGSRTAGPGPPSERERPSVPSSNGSSGDGASPSKISERDAWGLFRRLPVRVERRGHREKTIGLWRDADGNDVPLISGIDQYREMADRLAVEKNLGDPPHTLAISSHVEIKFALMMRDRGLKHETIAVNKKPCDGDLGCDQMLNRFLPQGGTLTVYGPAGFKQTYRSTEQDG